MSRERFPQMSSALAGIKGWNPISELMRAIMLRVVEDYNSAPELRTAAADYLHDEDEEYVFSFKSICQHLGLDPDKTRCAIMHPKHKIPTRRRAA